MFRSKIVSGAFAVVIYFLLIYLVLFFYNIKDKKAKNYVKENSERVMVTLVDENKVAVNKKKSKTDVPTTITPKIEPKIKEQIPLIPIPKIKRDKKEVKEKEKRARRERIRKEKEAKESARRERIRKERDAKERARRERIRKEREAKERARRERIRKEKEAKERARRERIRKEREAKERARRERIRKEKEAKERARRERIRKEREAKERARRERIRKEKEAKERARRERIRKEREAKERARRERSRDLFSSIGTTHQEPQSNRTKRRASSITDRIKNMEKGVKRDYIAKVKKRLETWHAQSRYKGHSAVIVLTIKSSGHFRFRIVNSTNQDLTEGLKEFLDQLNNIGLGTHQKSTPYEIRVKFRAK